MRVLFVVKEYLPKPTPPGLCVMNVRRALFSRGVQSDVLMVGDREGSYCSEPEGDVFSIESGISFEKKWEGALKYILTRIPMLFTWPVPSMKRVRDYRRMISKLNDERKYDAIIGTMFPPDVCVACSAFDHFFYYELDSLINNPMYKEGFKKYLSHRLKGVEEKLFDKAELIIHLNHNKLFYSKERYQKYSHKSIYTDIPNLLGTATRVAPDTELTTQDLDDEKLLIVYSGYLSAECRSPSRAIELIKELSKHIGMRCLFFSRGDCEEQLRKADEDTKGVVQRMGYVSQETLSHYTDKADYLLDIGNHLSGEDFSLPSKVISYMAIGKPIIHLNGTNDSAIPYLEKYGLAINLQDDLPIDESARRVLEFVHATKGKRISFSTVAEMFPQNTPEYTADLIIRQINSREEKSDPHKPVEAQA